MSRPTIVCFAMFVMSVGLNYVVADAEECNCSRCCTIAYCKCMCTDTIRQCVSYSAPQAFDDLMNFTGGPDCGGTYKIDGGIWITTWSNYCLQCYCYDFYGAECDGPQQGECGAAFRLDGVAGQHYCEFDG